MTKVQAIVKVIKKNGGKADWSTIYKKIGKHYPDIKRTGLTDIAKAGIRGVLYRDCGKGRKIFKKVGEGIFTLK